MRRFGTRARAMLGGVRRAEDLGRDFGASLTEREVDRQVRDERTRAPEDVVWPGAELGFGLDPGGRAAPTGRAAE